MSALYLLFIFNGSSSSTVIYTLKYSWFFIKVKLRYGDGNLKNDYNLAGRRPGRSCTQLSLVKFYGLMSNVCRGSQGCIRRNVTEAKHRSLDYLNGLIDIL